MSIIENRIRYMFRRTRAAGNKVVTHTHGDSELVYYLSGHGKTEIAGEVYRYGPGDFCLIAPGVGHSEEAAEKTDVLFAVFTSPFRAEESLFIHDDRGEVGTLFLQMKEEYEAGGANLSDFMECYIRLILHKSERLSRPSATERLVGNPLIDTALTYINDYYNTDISLTELAESVGYSYDRFRHLFKEKYGLSPKKMILHRRVDAAKQRLVSTDDRIEQIALDCGFVTAGRMNVAFRQEVGISPREYRKTKR